MKKIFLLILVLLLLLGCSPQKRLQRIIEHHPELVDTTHIKDTIVQPGWQYDTIVQLNNDTVVVQKDGVTVTLYKWKTDSIFVEVEKEQDTVFVDVPCPQINNPLEVKDEWYIEYWWLILLIFVAILFILNKLFK